MADRIGICWLERSEGEVRADRLAPSELADLMLGRIEPGFDLFRAELTQVVVALAARGGWRLRFGGHPSAAVPTIRGLLDQVDVEGSSV